MPREIKFRAWDKKEKIMYKPRTVTNIPLEWGRTYPEGDIFVPRYEFMQFTGLRDSKRTAEYPEGQEIYEGDITDRGTVEYWKGKFLVVMRNDQCWDDLCWCHGKITVIGNIHDNTGGQLNE